MSAHGDVATGPGWELRCGDYRDVLADVECDAVITDPPYSDRTHAGHGAMSEHIRDLTGQRTRRAITYDAWADDDVIGLASWASDASRGWVGIFTDHHMMIGIHSELERRGRLAFAPVPWIAKRPRLLGDGPASWACYLVVARPRTVEWSRWGCLPGAYLPFVGSKEAMPVVGGKPLWLMRAIVRDYSRRGHVVADPCAGGGTTLLAAVMEGRTAIGAELDPDTYDLAVARLRRGWTQAFDFGGTL